MPKLLKILTGPQEGAELELDEAIAMRLGTDETCDAMLVDTMAPPQALELILENGSVFVTAIAERIFVGDTQLVPGNKTALEDYAVITIGSTRCAVGDSEQAWPPLRWLPLDALLAKKTDDKQETQEAKEESATPEPQPEEDAPLSREQIEKLDELQSKKRAARRRRFALMGWLLLILLVLGGMWCAGQQAWKLTAPSQDQLKVTENSRQSRLEHLQEKIDSFGLTLELDEDGKPQRITGNLPHATQRALMEQIVKYDYPQIVCELTDDETLATSVAELLKGVTDDRIRLVSLKDRIAKVMGMASSEQEWETIRDNIRNDIPRLQKLESEVVFADVMAAKLREALKKTGFHDVRIEILPGELQFVGFVPENRHQDFTDLLSEAVKFFPENAKLSNLVKWRTADAPAADGQPETSAPHQLPITGIVVHPYPFVILADGQRLGVGSQIGDYVIDEINLTEVALSHDREKIIWHP